VTVIRAEAREDALGISALLEASFGSRQVPGLVDMIRTSPEYEPDLALVAEDGTELVGFVLFSRLPLLSPAGRWWSVLVLSPLAVRPDRVGKGIGSALTRDGLARADHRGEALVVLEGDPGYYARFGFERATALGIERPSSLIPQAAFQLRTLSAYDPRMNGRIVYPEAFWRCDAVGPSPRATTMG
jgi:putative acetyltransferase